MRSITVMACGGTGGNIASKFAEFHDEHFDGFADLKTFFVDTSRSNMLKSTIPDDRIFMFKDKDGKPLDGNGKVRSSNYDVISEPATIKQILHKFPQGDLTVLIHSASGGTGSVTGPLLTKELISRNQPVVVILVGSVTSMLDLKNTLNTLKTYETMSANLGVPINVIYRENNQQNSRSTVDKDIEQMVYLLSAFFSGQNHGLDTADLRNFLNYNKSTQYPPRLTALDLFGGALKLPEDALAIASVSLTTEPVEVDHEVFVDYQVTGVAPTCVSERIQNNFPLHMVVFSGFFGPVVTKLQAVLKQHEEKAQRLSGRTIVSSSDHADDNGMVF